MTYEAPAWAYISKSNMKRLQAVQIGRSLIGGYDWYTRVDKMLSDLEIIKLKRFMKLFVSARKSRNSYIKS